MDFYSAVVWFFLLIPHMNPEMQFTWLHYKPVEGSYFAQPVYEMSEYQQALKRNELLVYLGYEEEPLPPPDGEEFFVDDDFDDVPLPDGLENPLFGPQSAGSSLVTGQTEDGEQVVPVAEKQYLNSLERLRLFTYGEEEFVQEKDSLGRNVLVSVNSDVFIRSAYDSDHRITEKVFWKNGKTLADIKLTKKISYGYKGNGVKPDSINEQNMVTLKSTDTVYDRQGNPSTVRYYNLKVNEETGQIRSTLAKKVARTFNRENKVLEEEECEYFFDTGSAFPVEVKKKNKYTYTKKSSIPDFEFYENDVLRIKVNYSDEDSYVQTVYFDDDYSVQTKFSKGKKQQEIFFAGTVELKRRSFE